MAPALTLTEEKAAEAGLVGAGPFVFPGVFPGVYFVGRPLAVSELGFADEDEARAAFEDAALPLEWGTVAAGEGVAVRPNHAASERQARAAREATDDGPIRTHADADAAAAELGIGWPEGQRLTVAEKVEAIEAVKAGGTFPAGEEGGE